MQDKLLKSGGALDKLAALDPDISDAVKKFGPPEDRSLPVHFDTLARSVIGQQISRAAATVIWYRMQDQNIQNPDTIATMPVESRLTAVVVNVVGGCSFLCHANAVATVSDR